MNVAVLYLLPVVATLGLGGSPAPVLLGCLLLAAVGHGLALRRGATGRTSVGIAAACFVAVVGWQLLSLVPLSASLLSVVAPRAAALRETGARVAGLAWEGGAWSLAPGDTALATAGTALTAVLLLLVTGRGRRERSPHLHRALMVAGGVLVLVVCIHAVGGLDRIYGVFPPKGRGLSRVLGPFTNSNDLAVACCALVPLAVVDAVHTRSFARAWAVGLGVALVLVAFLTMSRSVGLALGVEACVGLVVLLAAGRGRRAAAVLGASVVGGAATFLLVSRLEPRLLRVFAPDALVSLDGRMEVWSAAWTMAKSHWLTGVGADAFGSVWWSVRPGAVDVFFQDAEGIVPQVAATLGLPVTGVLLLAAGVVLIQAARGAATALRDGDPLPLAGLAGLAGLLSVTQVSMTSSQPSVAIFAVYLFGLTRGELRVTVKPRWLPSALGLLLVLVAVAGVAASKGRTLPETDAWFRARLSADSLDPGEDPVAIAMLHPADPYGWAWAGQLQRRSRPGPSLRLANHAMGLDRWGAEPHRVAANVLLAAGRERQARGEIRLAMTKATKEERPRFVRDALARFDDDIFVNDVVPSQVEPALAVAHEVNQQGRRDLALRVWFRLARHTAPPLDAVAAIARLTSAEQLAEALEVVTAARIADPDPVFAVLEGIVRDRAGVPGSVELLRGYLEDSENTDDLWRGRALYRLARRARAAGTLGELEPLTEGAGAGRGEEAMKAWIRAELYLERGEGARALRELSTAHQLRPDLVELEERLQAVREELR